MIRSTSETNFSCIVKSIPNKTLTCIQDVLELPFNTWYNINSNVKQSAYNFQRGIYSTGESLMLLANYDINLRTVSFVAIFEFSDKIARRINSSYSYPLSVRGKCNDFYPTSYGDKLTVELITNLQDPNYYHSSYPFPTPIGNRYGETQTISRYNMQMISDVGLFTPTIGLDFHDPINRYYYFLTNWMKGYIEFYLHVKPDPSTHSIRFKQIQEIDTRNQDVTTKGELFTALILPSL